MTVRALLQAAPASPCHPVPRRLLSGAAWAEFAAALATDPSLDLRALWADPTHVHALLVDPADGSLHLASVAVESGLYTALSPARPAAAWFERMIRDLWGHTAADGLDLRPWLDHGAWTASPPLAARPSPNVAAPDLKEFLPVEGADLHRILVGPVHAGIIEPGHFHFTCDGETVVRLEIRLGYLHKGTLGLLRGKSPRTAARFAARLSGDSTVAHSIAFARAAEAACQATIPPRATALRAVMAELERLANHLGDIGAIVNDAAFPLLQSRFVWQREAVLRASDAAFGHRLMMDLVIPGGVASDITPDGAGIILSVLEGLEAEWPRLLASHAGSASLQDRTRTTGHLDPQLAARFAPGGVIGRASGRNQDCRLHPGYPPYDGMTLGAITRQDGDVEARIQVRMAEVMASIALLRQLLATLPELAPNAVLAERLQGVTAEGIGWAEGFRGDIWHWLRIEGGLIAHAFLCDPSWRQWPLLEAAVIGNIVADFPLCNKSFNCSYSGVDL